MSQKWNTTIYNASHGELNRLALMMGVEQARSSDMHGDIENRIWDACLSMMPTITKNYVEIVSGNMLDQVALCYDLTRSKGSEYDQSLRKRIYEAIDLQRRQASGVKNEPLSWASGRHFCRTNKDGTKPVNAANEAELYRVLHPGLEGGSFAFVLRIDTGEELLFDRSSTTIRMIDDNEELKERLQESSFKALMQRYENGEISLGIAMHAARSILLPPGTKC